MINPEELKQELENLGFIPKDSMEEKWVLESQNSFDFRPDIEVYMPNFEVTIRAKENNDSCDAGGVESLKDLELLMRLLGHKSK